MRNCDHKFSNKAQLRVSSSHSVARLYARQLMPRSETAKRFVDLQKRVAVERPGMPIIFITGHGDIPMTVQAMKAGAVEFLTKPFKGDVLLQSIRNAVERSRALLGRE
jgi:FixJ family two-component response regulator